MVSHNSQHPWPPPSSLIYNQQAASTPILGQHSPVGCVFPWQQLHGRIPSTAPEQRPALLPGCATSNSDNSNKEQQQRGRPDQPCTSHGRAQIQQAAEHSPRNAHDSPSSETITAAFSRTLATLPCSPTARSSTTATATATRHRPTASDPYVSVFSSFRFFLLCVLDSYCDPMCTCISVENVYIDV